MILGFETCLEVMSFTPGFGNHINNEDVWRPIEDYIELQYKTVLQEECRDFGLQDSMVRD